MRVRLQVHLKQLTENQASAIKSDVRKISGKQIGQVVFVVQSPGGEATARERRASLLGRIRRASLLGPRSSHGGEREKPPGQQ
jgi:ClpP class serine protease